MGAYHPTLDDLVSSFKNIKVEYYIKDESVNDNGLFEKFWEQYGAKKACLEEEYLNNVDMEYHTKELKNFARVNRKAGNLSEALLWNELKQRKMGVQFKRQRPIGAYIADFYCKEKNMVIEIDGWSHDNKYEYDQERDEYIKSLGIFVLRISDIDVKRDMNNVLIWIKHNIDNR